MNNLDLLIGALDSISGAVGDANWWTNEAADLIPSITDDVDEQMTLADLLDSIHQEIARLESAIESLTQGINDGEDIENLRFPKVSIL